MHEIVIHDNRFFSRFSTYLSGGVMRGSEVLGPTNVLLHLSVCPLSILIDVACIRRPSPTSSRVGASPPTAYHSHCGSEHLTSYLYCRLSNLHVNMNLNELASSTHQRHIYTNGGHPASQLRIAPHLHPRPIASHPSRTPPPTQSASTLPQQRSPRLTKHCTEETLHNRPRNLVSE